MIISSARMRHSLHVNVEFVLCMPFPLLHPSKSSYIYIYMTTNVEYQQSYFINMSLVPLTNA